jgi:DHA2 family multidrug resistance protein-like MFS transporter
MTPIPRAGSREWIGLGVIAIPCMLYSMDLTVLDLAVPRLSVDLRPTSAQLLWILDIYGFVLAACLIPMGTLGDRIGRRRLLMIGAAAFGAASILAAFSRSAGTLIAARALLGIAGATLAPSTLSLIRNMFADATQRSFAIGVWVASYSVGGAVGPLVGGLLLDHFWWGSVFLISVPAMVLLLVVGPMLLPEFRDPDSMPVDVRSAALSLAAVLCVVYGMKRIAQSGIEWSAVWSILVGLTLALVFVRRQRRLTTPLIDLRLFRVRAFSVALATYSLATFVVFGFFLFISQYLQLVRGLSSLRTGVYMLPMFVAFVVGGVTTPILARRVRPTTIVSVGLAVAAVGFTVLTLIGVSSSLGLLAIGSTIYALGLSPVSPLATDMLVGAAPPDRAGVASALSETGAELGGALGVAVIGSIGTAVYRSSIGHVTSSGLSSMTLDAARGTLGGAVGIAARLPAGAGAELASVARDAFSRAMNVAALVSALLMLAGLVAVTVLLREQSPDPLAGD